MEQEEKRGRGRPRGPAKKMSMAEVEEFKTESIKKIFDEHLSYTEYIKWSFKKGVSRSRANDYWKRIWKDVREKYDLERDNLVTKHLKKYWKLHDEALEKGDLNTARHVLNDIAKLKGLNEPDRVEQTGTQTIKFNFGDEVEE